MMRLVKLTLLLAMLTWSAFANTPSVITVGQGEITFKAMERVMDTQNSTEEPGDARDLRNGNYALVCQDEQGTYLTDMLNYVYSPVVNLPAGTSLQYDFQVRGSFTDPNEFPAVDYWGCEVSPDGGETWFYISNPYGDPTGSNYVYSDAPAEWASFVNSYTVDSDLSTYSGTAMQFRWYFQSDADAPQGEGLMIDDFVLIADGATVFLADFEDGTMTGWETEDATATPPLWHQTTINAYSGQSWAMNDPELGNAGGYLDHWYQTLDSPAFTVTPGQTNTVTFQQRRNVEDPAGATSPWDGWDGTNVRISVDDGASWEVLTDVSPAYNSSSMYSFGYEFNEGEGVPGWGGDNSAWEAVTVTIPSDYEGATAKIRFAFASDPGYNTEDDPTMFGWIIDDINIAGQISNDGETADGWVAESQVPIAGDLWHVAFVGALPVPVNLVAESGDSEVSLSWSAPISGAETELSYDNPAAYRYYLNDSQPYGVVFEATEDNTYLGSANFYMLNTAGPFEGTIDALVYSVGVDNLPAELLYTASGIVPSPYPSATAVDLSGTGISFSAGEKFALCVGGFTASSQGILADSLSTANPASGNSVVWGGDGWYEITEAYTGIANLAIRAEIIIPDAAFAPEGYNVYRRTAATSFGAPLVADLTEVSYVDMDVTNGETYYYAVSANYENGESPLSLEAMALPESQTVYTLYMDDGTAENGFNLGSGGFQAVKYTPDGYPSLLKRIKVYVNNTPTGTASAIAYVWDDDGADGMPLAELVRTGWSGLVNGWNTKDISDEEVWITGGSFYVGLKEVSSTPSIGADTDNYSGNSYFDAGDGWDNMANLGLEYNLMFRVDVDSAFVVVGVDSDTKSSLPTEYTLHQNFPNPFNPSTEIAYTLPEAGQVDIRVFDLTGREVDVLVQEVQPAGYHKISLDASHMDSGMYIYTLSSGNTHLSRKMILLK